MWPTAAIASSSDRRRRGRSGAAPRPPRPSPPPSRRARRRRQALSPAAPKRRRSPGARRFAGRAKACQRDGSIRAMQRHRDPRVAAVAAQPLAVQLGRDHLGVVEDEHIARREQVRQVADMTVVEAPPPGSTTSSRAASRGRAGRSAIRSSGRSKSKRSTRMPGRWRSAASHHGVTTGNRPAPAPPMPSAIRMIGQHDPPVDDRGRRGRRAPSASSTSAADQRADRPPWSAGGRRADSSSRRRRAQ